MARFTRLARRIRRFAAQGRYTLTPYAEMRKGLRELEDDELLAVLTCGKVVEVYPDRGRAKICGRVRGGEALNVVVEFDVAGEILIIISTFFEDR